MDGRHGKLGKVGGYFMAYSESLAERVRQTLDKRKDVAEKKMMGGLTFMVNEKMCVGVLRDDLMVRLDPEIYDQVLTKKVVDQWILPVSR